MLAYSFTFLFHFKPYQLHMPLGKEIHYVDSFHTLVLNPKHDFNPLLRWED